MTPSRYLTLVALALLPTGCPLLEVEAEVAETCVRYPGIQVDGTAAGTRVERSFVVEDLSSIRELAELDASLEFVSARVTATSGITSLAFVDAAHVTIASNDPTSPLPSLAVYDCDGDCVPEASSLTIPAAIRHDALAYVESGSIVVDLELAGQVPPTTWTMDVDVCFAAKLAYTYEP